MRMWAFVCVWVVVLTARGADAQVIRPCVLQVEGGWKLKKAEMCVQYTEAEQRAIEARLHASLHMETKVVPLLQERVRVGEAVIAAYEKARAEWGAQEKRMHSLLALETERADKWRTALAKSEEVRSRGVAWHQHPAVWFTVGATIATVVAVAIVAVMR